MTFSGSPVNANEDYLDQRWDKTGCSPLNNKTKNALVITDFLHNGHNEEGQYVIDLYNTQYLLFDLAGFNEYTGYAVFTSGRGGASENSRIRKLIRRNYSLASATEYFNKRGIDTSSFWILQTREGLINGFCYLRGSKYKGSTTTVYLFKGGIGKTYKKDSKKYGAYKFLTMQSNGKGLNRNP